MKLVFDIETVGEELEDLSESQQEYLLRYADGKIDDVRRYLSLYPFTARVVSIGMLNVKSGKLLVMYVDKDKEEWTVEDKKIKYISMSEKEMLTSFWEYISKCEQIITFNGRNFDIPFLMLRSSILGIKPSRNFIKNRYDATNHIDLQEKLTFHGLIRKFNLDFYCQAYGIESPKSKGITGMEVKELYISGKIKDIAIYCGKDVTATYALYEVYKKYLDL